MRESISDSEESVMINKIFLFGLTLALKSRFLDGWKFTMSQKMMTRTTQKSKKSVATRYDVIFYLL